MNYITLLLIVFGVTIQQTFQKLYSSKHSGCVYTFSAATALFAVIFFVATSGGNFYITLEAFWYALGFALAYGTGTVASFMAIATGPLSISNLIVQYALIIPALYGIIFLDESVSLLLVLGIIFLLISLFLVNIEKKGEQKKITLKWGIFALLAFLGNGACSTIQKAQQIACDGMYKNQFMIVSISIVVVVLLIFALKNEKDIFVPTLKNGLKYYAGSGLVNGLVNLLVMVLATRMNVSLMFPIISGGGTILTALASVTFFKEKLSIQQIVGLMFGTVAIVILSI